MSCQKFSRQYLHMVLSAGRGLYALSHVDVSRLFYPSKEEAKAAHAEDKKNGSNMLGGIGSAGRLPEPTIHYEPFTAAISYPDRSSGVFALFGKSNFFCSDSVGHSSIYNTEPEPQCFLGLPRLDLPKGPKHITICIPRTEAHVRSDYEVTPIWIWISSLIDATATTCTTSTSWTWTLTANAASRRSCTTLSDACVGASSHHQHPLATLTTGLVTMCPAVVDGTKICISSETATCYFDTVAFEWSKAGDCVLPFRAKAEYIPEFGLWLGLSAHKPYNLCSVNLSGVTIGSCDTQPPAQYVGQDVDLPGDCSLKNAALVNMGSGRFCIAKFFDRIHDHDNPQVVVLTGVELDPDDHKGEGAFGITKHKSECLASDSIVCVL
ncbi:hypothetical protein SEVIR_3G408000v4 [Setaria viridis]|uniref:Uncharacterized protein n=1 Tax=Setaria viridis TaxID=4556 RepID=A0A4U6VMS8_SETVI|nr:uncharacterized protein LOC117850712 [Setaria viridis]TKW29623.1 hypothetical protein SEVIR_3G408000v2 [Setaria viridis]